MRLLALVTPRRRKEFEMRKKLFFTTAVVAASGVIAAAAPAFTADNAALTVTVTAKPTVVPCVMFAGSPGTQVDFGTLPFSNASDSHVGIGSGSVSPRFSNCGTARENLFIAGTDAQNVCAGVCVIHSWRLGDSTVGCPALNGYQLWYFVDGAAQLGGPSIIRTTNVPLRKIAEPGQPSDYAVGEAHDLGLQIKMPCGGSDGAGEAFRLSVTVTAAVA
jgi:hypothetical protein